MSLGTLLTIVIDCRADRVSSQNNPILEAALCKAVVQARSLDARDKTLKSGHKASRSLGEVFEKRKAMTQDKRVLIIANKRWEAAPLLNVLREPRACPPEFDSTQWVTPRKIANQSVNPEATNAFGGIRVEIWCLENCLTAGVNTSSSQAKWNALPSMFSWSSDATPSIAASLVMAFGTAGFPSETSYNGCVSVGGRAYIHDAHPNQGNQDSPWDSSQVNSNLPETISADFFSLAPKFNYVETMRAAAESRFVTPPMNPAERIVLFSSLSYTALSTVNVTKYDEYAWADAESLGALHKADPHAVVGSIETTHALIRARAEKIPFLFVSALTDRLGHFDVEVTARAYAQNFACAHNAGIVLAWLLPQISRFLSTH